MKIYFSSSSQDSSIIEVKKFKQTVINSGHHAIIPDEDNSKSLRWTEKLNQRLKILNDCDGIFMLSDWRDSILARIELTAAMNEGKEIYFSPEELSHTVTTLDG